MARDRRPVARAYVLSILIHGALLAMPLPHGAGQGAGSRAPLQAILVNAVQLASMQAEDSEAVVPPQPDGSDVPQTASPPGGEPASESGSPLAGLPAPPPERLPPPYLTRAELHQQPIPLRPIDLAQFARIYPGARARFTVLIDEKGNVDAVDVHEGSDRAFAEVFRSFLGKTRFVPGKMGGRPVRSQIIVETTLPEARPAAAPQGDSMAPMRLP